MAKNSDIRQAWTEAQADALYRDHKAKEAAQARNETNTVEGDHHGMTGGVHDGGQFKFQLRSGRPNTLAGRRPPLRP
ncbi:hypothetical protein ACFZCT_31895 [Streptomyces qaidamensis]|jgi:hypothetical protein|uniref:hypothetical protein n=1 Tax=Streptomyces qaidamensis TaxID=1783515 RepID=UPI0036E3C8A6